MNIRRTPLDGVLLVEPTIYADSRGYFLERFRRSRYAEHGIEGDFLQDNASFSKHGVVRGLHFQNPDPQSKLVEALTGAIFDVAVDLRRDSPTFGRWHGETLTSEKRNQLWVPAGFAHGFQVLSPEGALVGYKVSGAYNPQAEHCLSWDDPDVGIAWPLPEGEISPKDAAGKRLRDLPAKALW